MLALSGLCVLKSTSDMSLRTMVESVAAATNCFVSGESMCPTSMMTTRPGKYSSVYVMTTG